MPPSTRTISLTVYIAITLIVSWIAMLALLVDRHGHPLSAAWIVTGAIIGYGGPSLVAMIYSKTRGAALIDLFRVRPGYSLVRRLAWIAGALSSSVVCHVLGAKLARLLGWSLLFEYGFPYRLGWWIVLVATALGEEIGWRGFLQRHARISLGGVRAILLVGVVSSLWHLPLLFLMMESTLDLSLQVVQLIAGSVIIAALFEASGGSMWVAIAAHIGFHLDDVRHMGTETLFFSTVVYTVIAICGVVWLARGERNEPRRTLSRGHRVLTWSSIVALIAVLGTATALGSKYAYCHWGWNERWVYGGFRIALSHNEKNIAVDTGPIVVSFDGGEHWLECGEKRRWNSLAISDDGNVVFASSVDGRHSSSGLSLTTDRCKSWRELDRHQAFELVAMSADGRILATAGPTDVRLSIDGGTTWNDRSPDKTLARPRLRRLALSSTGDRLVVVGDDTSGWESTDQGIHWTKLPEGSASEPRLLKRAPLKLYGNNGDYSTSPQSDQRRASRDFALVTASGDGRTLVGAEVSRRVQYNEYDRRQIAAGYDGAIGETTYASRVFVSKDGGRSFVELTRPWDDEDNARIEDIAVNHDGTKAFIVGRDMALWIRTLPR